MGYGAPKVVYTSKKKEAAKPVKEIKEPAVIDVVPEVEEEHGEQLMIPTTFVKNSEAKDVNKYVKKNSQKNKEKE